MADPSRLTATEAARAIRAGALRPEALMEACLARIAEREPRLRAFTYLDPDAARRAAASAAAGPLHGLPVAVKDVLDTADMPTEYGSPIYAGHRPRADAAVVALAKRAGGVAIGKTVTTEFATRKPGPTVNPHDHAHTPGGSSSGSAAAIADFCVPLAFGSQTAGSVIRPAAFCGIVGFKPTYATLPIAGMKIMSESLDTIGVLARTVADCALLLSAMTGRDLGDPDAKPDRPPRVGVCRTYAWPQAETATMALLDDVAAGAARAGATVVERDLPDDFTALAEAQPAVMNGESALSLAWELTVHPDEVSDLLRPRLLDAAVAGPEVLERGRATFRRLQALFPSVMGDLDVLLTPSAPGEAPEGLG
ncbi:MAG TPA: amidase, partial [Acetobacteraceae bacterium]|nr:amidase [Acetobacteraceae bacterium]